jgi:sialate O-acetylesterase
VRNFRWTCSFLVGLGCLIVSRAHAAPKPHGLFHDNMVLQQGMKVPVWGTADPGEKISVTFQGQESSATADQDGKWQIILNDLKAGGPFELGIAGNYTITIKNVLVGEVWTCTGQSNMEWPMTASRNPKKDIAASANPMIRLFRVPKTPNAKPQTDFGRDKDTSTGKWQVCGPDTVARFSAVGYFFGRDLHKARNVPIGLIQCAWGGTAAERWTRKETYDLYPELKGSGGSDLYNGMLAPLIPFALKGSIWYQGESNAGQAYKYRTLFPAMIKNWRDDWKQDFTFLFVQLAPWDVPKEATWPELREAQLMTAQKVPNTAMAVITDFGDPKDIHPKDKDPVGARLALCARAIAYGEKVPYSGPEYSSMKVEGPKVVLSFKHVEGGLVAKGGDLKGFTVAGQDERFVPAEASIEGDTVVVQSKDVVEPVAVRYGWANYPMVNLYNKAGLPASPFRTDDFRMITRPKTSAGTR